MGFRKILAKAGLALRRQESDAVEDLDIERLKTVASYWDTHPDVPEGATMYFPEDDTWEATWGMMEVHVYQFNSWNDDEQAWEPGLDLWLDDDFMRRGILKPGQTYETMLGPKMRIEAAGRSNTGTNEYTPSSLEQPEGVSGVPYVERKAMEAKDLASEQYLLERIEAEQQEFHRRTAEYHRQLAHLRATKGGH